MGMLVLVASAVGRVSPASVGLDNARISAPMRSAICMADAVFRWLLVLLSDVEAE